MPKHLAALLSMLGLAGSTVPATAQVLKGAKEATATTAETKVKSDKTLKGLKAAAETNAGQGAIKFNKDVKATTETNAIQSGIQDKHKKASAENAASHEDKWNKANAHMGDGSVRNATIGGGGGAGKVSANDIHVKSSKNAAEAQAASSQASKKAVKTGAAPKQ